jgi:PKD repeat protein
VNFTASSANVSNLLWSVDGNSFSTLPNPSYRFVNGTPGDVSFEINLRGTSSYNCTDDTTKIITVYPVPSAEFIPDPLVQDYNTELDQTTVTFYNETNFQDSWSYEWDYGDGTTDNQTNDPFEYTYGFEFWGNKDNNGKIPVRLVAWNTDNPECRDTVRGEIYIKPPLPQIALEEDISGCEPFTVSFVATTKYVYDDQLEWDFGEAGAVSTEVEPEYTYQKEGVYTAKLVVRGDGGTNWDYRIITVHPKPEVDFSFNDSLVFVRSQNRPDEVINFYNHTRYGETYEWYFENNLDQGVPDAITQNDDPTWYYEETGTYYVALVAISGESCMDTMVHPIPIQVLGEASIQFPTGFFADPTGARDEYVSDPEDTDIRIFRPYAQGVAEYKLEVYNRWGVLVFTSDDVNRGWNGYIDGKPAKQDVYVWRAKGRFTNGQPFEVSGDVTLIVAPISGQQP